MPLLPIEQIEQLSPVFQGKAGNSLASALRKMLGISKLSDEYDTICSNRGPEFAAAMMDKLELDYKISGYQKLLNLPEGPFITISNHPYGGMDGVILIDIFGHLRDDFKVMVTEFLKVVEALTPNMIAVNPKTDLSTGVTQRNVQAMKEVITHVQEGKPVGFFPAGAVSNLEISKRAILDREWQTSILRLIQKLKVTIIPVRFFGRNSMFFYSLGKINWIIRTLRLPRELMNKKGTRMDVGIGDFISVEEQLKHKSIKDFGEFLRDSVYGMKFNEDDSISYHEFIAQTRGVKRTEENLKHDKD